MADTKDQNDVIAQNEKLTKDLSSAQKEATDAKSELQKVTGEKSGLESQLTKANEDKATAEKNLATANKERDEAREEVKKLQASQSEFDKKLSAELSKHGIRSEASKETVVDPNKKLTLTEQCRLAKGQTK